MKTNPTDWPGYAAEIGPFGHDLSVLCSQLALTIMADGASEADAVTAVINVLINCAAGQACRNAIKNLGRDPDAKKWRAATDKAFARAVKRCATPVELESASE